MTQRMNRPWRRVGTALAVLIAVMFLFGLRINPRSHPSEFLAFWSILLVLLVWLCILAVRDILFTRRLTAEWKRRCRDELAGWGDSFGDGDPG